MKSGMEFVSDRHHLVRTALIITISDRPEPFLNVEAIRVCGAFRSKSPLHLSKPITQKYARIATNLYTIGEICPT